MMCAHAHTHRPPSLFFCGGVASVLPCRASRTSRVPALCGEYARAALCGPLVASRPSGDLKKKGKKHYIALGPRPVSPSLHRASIQKSARGGRTPKRFYRTPPPATHSHDDAKLRPSTPCLWQAPASTQKTKKVNQADHSSERAVEGQGGQTHPGFKARGFRGQGG